MPPNQINQLYPKHQYDKNHIDEFLKGDIGSTIFQPIDNLQEMYCLEFFDEDYDEEYVHHISKSDLPHGCT